MGAGASKQSAVRRKIQAVSAFEDAGRRNREKRKSSMSRKSRKKSTKSPKPEETGEGDITAPHTRNSSWVRLREKSLSGQEEIRERPALKLSDFNKVVRKRTIDPEDGKPLDIPYGTQPKVHPDELCHICSVYTGRETYPCRICCKVYHEGCLRKLGHCNDPASSMLLKRALKPRGWSCHQCDDLSNMLTEEELLNLLDSFEKFNLTQDSSMSLEDYLDYRKRAYKDKHSCNAPKLEVQNEMAQFHRLDRENTGSITWWEFLNFESLNVIQKRGKNAVTRLLHPREVELSYRLFHVFDEEDTGEIKEYDARKAVASWFTLFLETDEKLDGFTIMSSNKDGDLWYILAEMLTFTMDTSPDAGSKVTWHEFLRELSIYVIAARPNLSPVPVDGSDWTKGVVVSTETDCDVKRTSL